MRSEPERHRISNIKSISRLAQMPWIHPNIDPEFAKTLQKCSKLIDLYDFPKTYSY